MENVTFIMKHACNFARQSRTDKEAEAASRLIVAVAEMARIQQVNMNGELTANDQDVIGGAFNQLASIDGDKINLRDLHYIGTTSSDVAHALALFFMMKNAEFTCANGHGSKKLFYSGNAPVMREAVAYFLTRFGATDLETSKTFWPWRQH